MWNLNKPKLIDTENRLVVARGRGWKVSRRVKVVKRYRLPVLR